MITTVANAPRWDSTQQNLQLVLSCIGGIVVVAILVGVVVALARKRRHPNAQTLTGLAIVWGMVAAASVVYTVMVQLSWQKSHTLEMLSGYGDSQEVPPGYPWMLWIVLFAAYLVLLLGTVFGGSARRLDR